MDNTFMKMALSEAEKAAVAGEIPVGAVLVKDGQVIARGHNLTMEKDTMLAHAELLVIEEALQTLSVRRLTGCSLYVTLEPCPMCAGAILLSRPDRVYFGAYDANAGACGGKHDVLCSSGIEVYGGIMEAECSSLLQRFFAKLRTNF
ncbi:MAG: nucleoside deaminase [Clostridia bacterium]|nr:nucleoside deaminase [Clostridia bacterium]